MVWTGAPVWTATSFSVIRVIWIGCSLDVATVVLASHFRATPPPCRRRGRSGLPPLIVIVVVAMVGDRRRARQLSAVSRLNSRRGGFCRRYIAFVFLLMAIVMPVVHLGILLTLWLRRQTVAQLRSLMPVGDHVRAPGSTGGGCGVFGICPWCHGPVRARGDRSSWRGKASKCYLGLLC